MRHQSLKMKWMLITGVTIFISYAAICFVIYMALHAWLLATEEQHAQRTVADLQGFFASQGVTVTLQDLQSQSGLMKAILNQDQTVRLYQLDGSEVLQINTASPAAALPERLSGQLVEEQTIEGVDTFVIHEVVQIGPLQAVVQLIHPLTAFQSMMRYIFTTMCLLGLGGIIAAVVISYYASTVMMRPLQQLRNSMRAVKEGGFESKVDFTYDANDEIGDLVTIYEEMLTRLEASFKRQQQFVSDASHELRTPIQSLEGHLSLMQRWGKDDPEVLAESLQTSLEEVGRMKKMLEELLQLARDERLASDVQADAKAVVSQLVDDFRFLHPAAVFDVRTEGQARPAAISEEALGQILRNLYENAIRYCEVRPHIETTLHFEASELYIEVKDNGIGIAEEHLPYVFDRFYKVDDARLHVEGSTGLGLSITKMLVDKYAGDVQIVSEIGKGTVFLVRFRIKK